MTVVRVLSFHATYRCRHSGACCTSNWPIPIEADRLARVRAAMASGELRKREPVESTGSTGTGDRSGPQDPQVLKRHDDRCTFHCAGRCDIHAALGHEALPLACRQFPRVSVHDPRGVSVTLSHYCPTAAGLLETADVAVEVVDDAPAFPSAAEYVGLDARDSLPPLLRRDMLMDWESWWEVERQAVELLDREFDPARATARLNAIVTDLERWSPGGRALIEHVRDAFTTGRSDRSDRSADLGSSPIDAVFAAIPDELRPARRFDQRVPNDAVARRFLAAHAFANWTIHTGGTLRTWLRSIEAAHALLLAGAGVRQADLLLRHLADPRALARALSSDP